MRNRVGLIVALLLLTIPLPARACSIPVFRYALERWKPTPYEFLIYHRGPLSDGDRKALAGTKALAVGANVEVADIDLEARVDPGLKAVWEKHGGQNPLPWVIARYPDSDLKTPPAWSGPLDPERIRVLVDSPARQKIVNALFRGNSAVFVLLESGNEKADAAALRLLETEIPKLQTSIELPAPSKEGPQVKSEIPVHIALSVVRLSRKTTEEKAFVELLLRCEDDLDKVKGPIVGVVFGRGRLLAALHGKDLKASEVTTITRFLCGACSCQVKELNPGMDLLFRTRWDAFLDIELAPPPRASSTKR